MDFRKLRYNLPTCSESFIDIRQRGLVYVDKTNFVLDLAQKVATIITRPRRFGKTTLQTTLEELFLHGVEPYDGHDSYFKGLAIEQLWQDKGQYLVLHLNFHEMNSDCQKVTEFEQLLIKKLESVCCERDLALPNAPFRFRELFSKMLEQLPGNTLVLLVDEYDAPFLRHINDEQELEKCKLLMMGLFSAIKSNWYKFRCAFFTGITRYQDLDLGTAGNNFVDLTNDQDFAACCGYTRDELKQYFAGNLRYAAAVHAECAPEEVSAAQIEALLDDMAEWYDGYSFDGKPQNKVFSTWSVLKFFANRDAYLGGYWSLEDPLQMPQLLKASLDRIDIKQLIEEVMANNGDIVVTAGAFMQSSFVNPQANPYSLLFQAGYLTLSKPLLPGNNVHLTCPNKEIRLAFAGLLHRHIFNRGGLYTPEYAKASLDQLSSLDPDVLLKHFQDLFSGEPYQKFAFTSESVVAAFINAHLNTLGLRAHREVANNQGLADCMFDLPHKDVTVVFEYKYTDSDNPEVWAKELEAALKQIKDRDYGNNASSRRTVARFGLVFSSNKSQRNIVLVGKESIFNRY